MPDSVNGYTKAEVIATVQDFVGNQSSTFQGTLSEKLTLWQHMFYKLHDWSFAHRDGVGDDLSITLIADTKIYSLNTDEIGNEMRNRDVEKIYSQTSGKERVLHKVDLAKLRKMDPGDTVTGQPTHWAPVRHNQLKVWPTPTSDDLPDTLFVDGKVLGRDLDEDSDHIDIPYDVQETFIQFVIWQILRRERDTRAAEEGQVFADMLRSSKSDDMRYLEENAQIQSAEEYYANVGVDMPFNNVIWSQFD